MTLQGAARRRSLLGKVAGALSRTPQSRRRVGAVMSAVREHVITVTALGCADAAAFGHSSFAGLLTAGACLLVLDFKIQG